MSSTIIKDVTNDKFEKLKQKYPKAVTSKRKNGSERILRTVLCIFNTQKTKRKLHEKQRKNRDNEAKIEQKTL